MNCAVGQNECVICRVFNKSSAGGKKSYPMAIGGLLQQVRMEMRSSSAASYVSSDELDSKGDGNTHLLPPVMDANIKENSNRASEPTAAAVVAHVTCFSNALLEDQKGHKEEEEAEYYSTTPNLSLVPDYCFHTSDTSASTGYNPFAASDFSPSSFSIFKMNMSAAPSNPLELSMNHHHHQLQRHSTNNPSGRVMQQLLQSNVHGVVIGQKQNSSKATDKEMLSNISQETGLTTEMNPEISSVDKNNTNTNTNNNKNNNNPKNVSGAKKEVPPTSAPRLHLDDCPWGC